MYVSDSSLLESPAEMMSQQVLCPRGFTTPYVTESINPSPTVKPLPGSAAPKFTRRTVLNLDLMICSSNDFGVLCRDLVFPRCVALRPSDPRHGAISVLYSSRNVFKKIFVESELPSECTEWYITANE